MMIMRPPQHVHGSESVGGSSGSAALALARNSSRHSPFPLPSVALASFSASSWEGNGPINSFSPIKDNEHQIQHASFWIVLKVGSVASGIC
jgi:hypothetical protein